MQSLSRVKSVGRRRLGLATSRAVTARSATESPFYPVCVCVFVYYVLRLATAGPRAARGRVDRRCYAAPRPYNNGAATKTCCDGDDGGY